jgi:hypothetical protein
LSRVIKDWMPTPWQKDMSDATALGHAAPREGSGGCGLCIVLLGELAPIDTAHPICAVALGIYKLSLVASLGAQLRTVSISDFVAWRQEQRLT